MSYFAVLDTETNWYNEVMSIGLVVADADTFRPVETQYYIFDPEYQIGGMFSSALVLRNQKNIRAGRGEALDGIAAWLRSFGVRSLFAYNANFDCGMLPEFSDYRWHDIMRLAAYRQYNDAIPDCADCFGTGRMKSGYGVEPMMRLLSGNQRYTEKHNALCDAVDELEIMRLLGHELEMYEKTLLRR